MIRYRLVQVQQNLKKRDFSGWRLAIAFLYLFLFHSLLRLTSFLSQNKNERQEREEGQKGQKRVKDAFVGFKMILPDKLRVMSRVLCLFPFFVSMLFKQCPLWREAAMKSALQGHLQGDRTVQVLIMVNKLANLIQNDFA